MTKNEEVKSANSIQDTLQKVAKITSNIWGKLPKNSLRFLLISIGSFSAISPLLLGSIYAFKHGLPVLEVIDALGMHAFTIILISFLITLTIAFYPILPGLMRINDPYLLTDDEKNGDPKKLGELHRHNIYRIGASLLPSLIITALIFLVASVATETTFQTPEIIGFSLSFGLATLATFGMQLSYKRLCNKHDLRYSQAYIPSMTTLVDVAFIWLWVYVIFQGFTHTDAHILEKIEGPASIAMAVFFILILALLMAFFFTVWAAHKNIKNALIPFAIVIAVLLLYYPGGSQLVTNHLKMMSQGGGVPVVISTDEQLTEEWPELFPTSNNKTDKSVKRRTSVLSLTLLTDSKVFVKLPKEAPQSTCYENVQIEFARDRVKSIAFIGERRVPLESEDKPAQICSSTSDQDTQ